MNKKIKLIRFFNFTSNPNMRFWIAPILLILAIIIALLQNFDTNVFGLLYRSYDYIVPIGLTFSFVAIGAGLVLAVGGVDLSTMGVLTFSGIIYAILLRFHMYFIFALIITIILACLIGFINGIIIVKRNAPPLIYTWAVSILLFSFSRLIANGQIIRLPYEPNISGIITDLTKPSSYNITIILFFIIISIGLINYFGYSRKSASIGANRNSALYNGININRNTIIIYMMSSILSSFAGIYSVYRLGNASTTAYPNLELVPIAIAVIGGTSMAGGYLRLSSVLHASFFWSTLGLIINNMYPSEGGPNQQEKLNQFFSVALVIIVFLFGKKLTGHTHPIQVEQKSKED